MKLTPLQMKLIDAAKLLLEARALAHVNADLYRRQHPENLSFSRAFDDVSHDLITNRTLTVESLIHMAERVFRPLLTETADKTMIEKDMKWIFRQNAELNQEDDNLEGN